MILFNKILTLLRRMELNPFGSIRGKVVFKTMTSQLQWKFSVSLYVIHFFISYLVMFYLEEGLANTFVDYFYWHHITLSTVGYGDLSPTTPFGKIFTIIWIIVIGICIFSTFLGEIVQRYIKINKDLINGKISLMNTKNHIVILGNTLHASKLIEQLRLDQSKKACEVVLVLPEGVDVPSLPKGTYLVTVSQFLSISELNRLSLQRAEVILIDTDDDGVNMALCLMIQQIIDQCKKGDDKPSVLSMFHEREMENIVESSCRDIECLSLSRNRVLATALTDVGTIKVNEAINCPSVGNATQFSMRLPDGLPSSLTYGALKAIEEELSFTLMGVEELDDKYVRSAHLNPPWSLTLGNRQRIFYISANRMNENKLKATILKNFKRD